MIDEPEVPAPANVVHISGIRCHDGPAAEPRPVSPPWPRGHAWRELMRRLAKKPVTKAPIR